MITEINPENDTLILKVLVHKRGNSLGINIPKPLREKLSNIKDQDELGFFIKTARNGDTFLAVAKISEEV